MPNIKSAKKRVKVTKVKVSAQNQMEKSALKTVLKKFDAAIVSGDKTAAEAAYKAAVKAVDKAAAKHLMHKNARLQQEERNDAEAQRGWLIKDTMKHPVRWNGVFFCTRNL